MSVSTNRVTSPACLAAVIAELGVPTVIAGPVVFDAVTLSSRVRVPARGAAYVAIVGTSSSIRTTASTARSTRVAGACSEVKYFIVGHGHNF